MQINIPKLEVYKKISFNLMDSLIKYILKVDIMNESEIFKVYNVPIHPRDSIMTTNKGFILFDNGSIGGTH